MKIGSLSLAAGLALALAGCHHDSAPAPQKEPVVTRETPIAGDAARFARALEYDCGAGGKLEVSLDYGDQRQAFTRINGGSVKTLAMDKTAQDGMSFAGGGAKLTMSFGEEVTYTDGAVKRTCRFVQRSLPAPTVAGVTRNLTLADAGTTVAVKKGEKVSISLVGVPTAGYVWGADRTPAFVKVSDGPGGPTSSAQMLPGFAGGNHWEVLIVEAISAGEGELVLAQRRPWEPKSQAGAETFKVKLKVG